MYFVSFTLVHHCGAVIFSLPVNVNVNVPLVHDACVILHVGPVLSNRYTPAHVALAVFHAMSATFHDNTHK